MAMHPLVIDLEGWLVTVIGGGEQAAERVASMLAAGAQPRVVAPDVLPLIATEVEAGRVAWEPRDYQDGDLQGARLVFATTGHSAVDQQVAAEARRWSIPCAVVEHPEEGTLRQPVFFHRGPLTVAVSAGESVAELDRRLLRHLDLQIPALYGHLAEIVLRFAARAREQIASRQERLAFQRELVAFLEGPEIHQDLTGGHLDGALAGARELLRKHAARNRPD